MCIRKSITVLGTKQDWKPCFSLKDDENIWHDLDWTRQDPDITRHDPDMTLTWPWHDPDLILTCPRADPDLLGKIENLTRTWTLKMMKREADKTDRQNITNLKRWLVIATRHLKTSLTKVLRHDYALINKGRERLKKFSRKAFVKDFENIIFQKIK